jgi:hypothetical protein
MEVVMLIFRMEVVMLIFRTGVHSAKVNRGSAVKPISA